MAIVILIISALLTLLWTAACMTAQKQHIMNTVKAQMCIRKAKINDINARCEDKLSSLAEVGRGESRQAARVKRSAEKKVAAEQKEYDRLRSGKIELFDIIPAAGYVVFSKGLITLDSRLFSKIKKQTEVIYGRPNASTVASHMVAYPAAYGYAAICAAFMVICLMVSVGKGQDGALIGGLLAFIALIVVYIPFDELKEKTDKRQAEITAQFPSAISKMALLVSSGMEVARAWDLVCENGSGVLYAEMRKTVRELDNNISPAVAYTNFMNNCGNKYTTKLATSIMQNLSKGNSEIGAVFNQMSAESWMEKKHGAKRLGELAQGKLLVPQLIMFAGILIMIMVPIFLNM